MKKKENKFYMYHNSECVHFVCFLFISDAYLPKKHYRRLFLPERHSHSPRVPVYVSKFIFCGFHMARADALSPAISRSFSVIFSIIYVNTTARREEITASQSFGR